MLLPGLRLFSGPQPNPTDMEEADALGWQCGMIDIYSNSWGPEEDRIMVSGPGRLLRQTLEKATTEVSI